MNPKFLTPLHTKSIRICTGQEMRELDRIAEVEYGIDPLVLMENAGRAAAQILIERYPTAGKINEILIFAGKGNNAGDAFVVARRLTCLDRKVRVFCLDQEAVYQGASKKNLEILKRLKVKMIALDSAAELEAFFKSAPGPHTVVDGILGTGLRGNLEGIFYDVVELINQNATNILALDIPSGVSGDTGAIHGIAIQADLTVSFGFPRMGHFLPPGAVSRGHLVNVDISLPPRFKREGKNFLLQKSAVAQLIQQRDRYGHKNSFGHSLLIGGSPGRVGALTMAARACHKMGTGLVTAATWEDSMSLLMAKLPDETMAVPLKLSGPEYETYKRNLNSYTSIVLGPGLGLRPEGRNLLEEILGHYRGPIVVDADALNLISDFELHDHLLRRAAPTVLTPHPGEMARLLKINKEEVSQNPTVAVTKAVARTHSVVLLKGAATLIASPEEELFLNHYPNDGMATAGSGDVLSGMIGGLLGQGIPAREATLLGVLLHSVAGEISAQKQGHRSMTAGDLIENIGAAFQELHCIDATEGNPQPSVEGRTWLL